MINYQEYLNNFLNKINVPYVSRENILHIFRCISDTVEKRAKIDKIISQYHDVDFDYKKTIKDFEDFALPRLRNECEVDALCICLLTYRLEKLYEKYGFSNDLYIETISDIRYKINECELVKKLSGIFCASWYEDIFKLKTFSLGRLQFQLVNNCYDIPGYGKDFKMISIHIPKSNEHLDENKVNESIKRAKSFFREKFGIVEPVFVCHSWILFPEINNFIPKDSNIIKFQKRFTIIKTELDSNYSELWRIFDREFNGLRSLKEDSSLRRGYKELVRKNMPIGQGIGYFKG